MNNKLFDYLVNKFYKDIICGRNSFTVSKAKSLAATLVGLSEACDINCYDIVKVLHKRLYNETSSFSAMQYFYYVCDELINYKRSK